MDITTANRLYELRKQHGYSQDELADKLNVSRQAISKWERSESSPDTDNLIALAKLYGVSLDELLNYTPAKSGDSSESNAHTQDENNTQNTQSALDDDKNDTSTFVFANDGDKVHIDENGIRVHDKDGSNVVIKGGIAKLVNKIVGDIHIEDGKASVNGQEVNSDDMNCKSHSKSVYIHDGHVRESNPNSKKISLVGNIVNGITGGLCLIAYLLVGFLCNLWHPGWIIFFLPIIVGGIFDTFAKRNPTLFPIVFIVTAVYLLLGCQWGLWHPYWALFLIIPIYYCIAEPIKSVMKKQSATIEIDCRNDHDDNDGANDREPND